MSEQGSAAAPRLLFEVFWCPSCGIVWADDEPPICKHGTNAEAHPPTRMEPIPSWHPYAGSSRRDSDATPSGGAS